MHHLSRFGVSLENDLLEAFDKSIEGLGYENRSEAIRDLIRDHLIQKKVGKGGEEVVIVVRGGADKVHEVAGKLIATKGVQNGKLVTTTPEMKQ